MKNSHTSSLAISDYLVLPILVVFIIGFLLAAYLCLNSYSTGSHFLVNEVLGSIAIGFFSILATFLIYAWISGPRSRN